MENTADVLLCHLPFAQMLYIACIAFIFEFVLVMLEPRAVFARGEEYALKKKVEKMQKEAEQFANPSTYGKWAKLSRQASAVEKELLEKQNERDRRELSKATTMSKRINGYKWPIIFTLIYFGTTRTEQDVIMVPEVWMYPFTRILSSVWSFPLFQSNTISLWFWGVMVSRVSNWVLHIPSIGKK